jgi:flagellar basal-body rod protein FlgB
MLHYPGRLISATIMLDRIDNQFNVQRAALAVATRRQELIASNIANADTPHYKARDLDFRAALDAALTGQVGGLALATTSPRHLAGDAAVTGGEFAGALKYRSEFQPSVDGNTVNMDIERGAFAENAVRIEAALRFLTDNIKEMQLAMSQ